MPDDPLEPAPLPHAGPHPPWLRWWNALTGSPHDAAHPWQRDVKRVTDEAKRDWRTIQGALIGILLTTLVGGVWAFATFRHTPHDGWMIRTPDRLLFTSFAVASDDSASTGVWWDNEITGPTATFEGCRLAAGYHPNQGLWCGAHQVATSWRQNGDGTLTVILPPDGAGDITILTLDPADYSDYAAAHANSFPDVPTLPPSPTPVHRQGKVP